MNQSFDYIIIGAGTAGCILANRLSENENIKVLGPVEAPIALLRGQFRFRILIKGNNRKNINKLTKKIVRDAKLPASVKLIIDVDPYSFM